jgi:hypothetical protein
MMINFRILCLFYTWAIAQSFSFSRIFVSSNAKINCRLHEFTCGASNNAVDVDDLFEKSPSSSSLDQWLTDSWILQGGNKPKPLEQSADGSLPLENEKSSSNGNSPTVPMFALMYKFKREFLDEGAVGIQKEHQTYCESFPRLTNSEEIAIDEARGVVILWAGLSSEGSEGGDKVALKDEIMAFMENDPLIKFDTVERWDLLDLSQK